MANIISIDKAIKALRSRWRRIVLQLTPKSKRFHRIYRSRYWGQNSESISGCGSTLEATRNVREQLPALLSRLDCQALLDLGCGDFNWMKNVRLECKYIGADIVDSIIQSNNDHYACAHRTFLNLDATRSTLPDGVDVVLCREVLFHLSNQDIFRVLKNVKDSTATYFISTNIDIESENLDTFTGGYRPLNLQKPPFNFPQPIDVIHDHGVSEDRYLCLWKVGDLHCPE